MQNETNYKICFFLFLIGVFSKKKKKYGNMNQFENYIANYEYTKTSLKSFVHFKLYVTLK